MEIGSATTATGFDAFRDEFNHLVEYFARKALKGGRTCAEFEEVTLLPRIGGTGRNNLLSQDVERRDRRKQAVKAPICDPSQ